MIDKIMKKVLVLAVAVLTVFSVNAQGKFGGDEKKMQGELVYVQRVLQAKEL